MLVGAPRCTGVGVTVMATSYEKRIDRLGLHRFRPLLPKGVMMLREKCFGRRKSTRVAMSSLLLLLLLLPSPLAPSHLTPPSPPPPRPPRPSPPPSLRPAPNPPSLPSAPAANLAARTSPHSCRIGSPVTWFEAKTNSSEESVPDPFESKEDRASSTKPLPRRPESLSLGVPRTAPTPPATPPEVAEVPDLDDIYPPRGLPLELPIPPTSLPRAGAAAKWRPWRTSLCVRALVVDVPLLPPLGTAVIASASWANCDEARRSPRAPHRAVPTAPRAPNSTGDVPSLAVAAGWKAWS